jgi:CheY-like chemotaxis protein
MRGDAGHASKALVMTGSSSTSGARNLRVVEHAPRVLIVEDELLVAWQLESMIRDQHLEVCGLVPDGQGAIEQAADLDVDLILMDIRLAGRMDGIEAARKIRESRKTPIIFITAHGDQQTRMHIDQIMPGVPVLAKPVSKDRLRDAIAAVMRV